MALVVVNYEDESIGSMVGFPRGGFYGQLYELFGSPDTREYLSKVCHFCLTEDGRPKVSEEAKDEARTSAHRLMLGGLLSGKNVICVGFSVWDAFGGRPDVEPFTWYDSPDPGALALRQPFKLAMIPSYKVFKGLKPGAVVDAALKEETANFLSVSYEEKENS